MGAGPTRASPQSPLERSAHLATTTLVGSKARIPGPAADNAARSRSSHGAWPQVPFRNPNLGNFTSDAFRKSQTIIFNMNSFSSSGSHQRTGSPATCGHAPPGRHHRSARWNGRPIWPPPPSWSRKRGYLDPPLPMQRYRDPSYLRAPKSLSSVFPNFKQCLGEHSPSRSLAIPWHSIKNPYYHQLIEF